MSTSREDTLQRLDPLGNMGARAIPIIGGAGALLYASVRTVAQRDQLDSEPLAVLALAALAIAVAFLAVRSGALRVPIGRRLHVIVLALGLIALTLNAASLWNDGPPLREDWGPTAVGILCLALSPYRPPRDIVVGGLLSAVYAGHIAVFQVLESENAVPAALQVAVTITPILALSLGGAVFSSTMIAFTKRWQGKSHEAAGELVRARLGVLTRSVQQDRVTILNRDVVPFFEDILRRQNITEQDRITAAAISERIRSAMVAEVDRSWLDHVVGGDPESRRAVHDPHHLAGAMTTDQRTALRAGIVALFDEPTYVRGSLAIDIARRRDGCRLTLTCEFTGHDPARRSSLVPYFAVFRVVFADLSVEFAPPALTVRFTYDQR